MSSNASAGAASRHETRASRLVVDPEDGHLENVSVLTADRSEGEASAAEPRKEGSDVVDADEPRAAAFGPPISWRRDGLRSWLVCFACFLVTAVTYGTLGIFPMFQLPLVELFQHHQISSVQSAASPQNSSQEERNQWVVSRVSFIAGLNNGLSYLFCVAVPPLAERFGCRLMFLVGVLLSLLSCIPPAVWPAESLWVWWLCYGVAGGVGAAILFIIPALVLEQNFERRFGLANGICSLGSSLGYAVLPLVWQLLMNIGAELANAPADSLDAQRVGVSLTMYFTAALFSLLLLLYPFFGSPFNIAVSRHSRSSNNNRNNSIAKGDTPSSTSLSQGPGGQEARTASAIDRESKLVSTVLSLLKLDTPMTGYKYGSDRHERRTSESATLAVCEQLTKYVRSWRAIMDRNMIIFVVVGMLYTLGIGVPDQHSVMLAELKFPQHKQLAGSTLVAYGLAQGIGRVLLGWLADVRFSALHTSIFII